MTENYNLNKFPVRGANKRGWQITGKANRDVFHL